jgi:hypothetical protein
MEEAMRQAKQQMYKLGNYAKIPKHFLNRFTRCLEDGAAQRDSQVPEGPPAINRNPGKVVLARKKYYYRLRNNALSFCASAIRNEWFVF